MAASLVLAATVSAQEPEALRPSMQLGVEMPSQYFFRGIVQENSGFIVQPWIELSVPLTTEVGPFGQLDLNVGQWNSLHTGPTGTSGGEAWYRSDFHLGLATSLGSRLSLGSQYTVYSSPNNSFATVQELSFSASYDDSEYWGGKFPALKPSATLAFEFKGQADGGSDEGVYLQLGVKPSFGMSKENNNFSLAVPVTVGLSLTEYYEDAGGSDNTFGFFDLGAEFSTKLDSIPERFGAWEVSAGVHLLWLGSGTEQYNNGDDFEIIASVGMTTSF